MNRGRLHACCQGVFALVAAVVAASSSRCAAGDFRMEASTVAARLDAPSFLASYVVHGANWKACGRLKGVGLNRASPPPADGKYPFTITVDSGPEVKGCAEARVQDGTVQLAYRGQVTRGGAVETVSVQGYLKKSEFAGGRVRFGEKTEALPTASAQMDLGWIAAFRIESADGARFLDVTCEKPLGVTIIGKADASQYTVRLSAVRHATLAAGQACDVVFTLRTGEPIVDVNRPWTTAAGKDFVALDYRPDVVPGSALDFSGIVPRAPCGTYGRLRAKGGHFEFEKLPGVRQRFMGMNLHSYACYHTPEEARVLIDRFVRCGYNAVRLHNYENEFMGLTMGSPDEATPVEARFEGLDNLLEACRARGVYVTVDLHIGRRTSYKAIGIDKPGMVVNANGMKGEMKYQYLTNPKARENFRRFIRGFFEHVSPHTGRRYADEPTLALVSVVNESPCCWARYGGKDSDLCAQEYDLMRELSAFIRNDLKSAVPLTTCNGGRMPFCLQPLRAAFCDYVDDHFYFDHPQFDYSARRRHGVVPLFTANRRYIADGLEISPHGLVTRLWGKPYVVTEFNWCAPSRYRASAGLVVGSAAAVQDWDGLWRYLWAHDHARALEPGRHPIARLESASDALAMATDRALMCLFLRGDMKPSPRKAAIVMKSADLDVHKPHPCVWEDALGWPGAGWYAQVGTAMDRGPEGSVCDFAYPGDVRLTRAAALERMHVAKALPAEGAIRLDRAANALTVVTPRTCGGTVEKGVFTAGPLRVACGNAVTTVWASALDGEPLASSRRILLTHLTNLYNTGDAFADRDGRYLLDIGRSPYLMPRATAQVQFRAAHPERLRVYALGTDGARRGEVPAAIREDALTFTCETFRDPANATFLYELVAEEPAPAR